ncbi:MAG TPA: hypothetical protein VI997_03555 [Candidatus Thermoplasmatota archaeon]|nr:hypothetical protein [Candidatus Thermoplasmatota archaeon]
MRVVIAGMMLVLGGVTIAGSALADEDCDEPDAIICLDYDPAGPDACGNHGEVNWSILGDHDGTSV